MKKIVVLKLDENIDPSEVAYATAFVKGYRPPVVGKHSTECYSMSGLDSSKLDSRCYVVWTKPFGNDCPPDPDIVIAQKWNPGSNELEPEYHFLSDGLVTEADLPTIKQEIEEPNSTG
jgi:hypothetical protein